MKSEKYHLTPRTFFRLLKKYAFLISYIMQLLPLTVLAILLSCIPLNAEMVISNIKIRKNFPIFERELFKVINLRIGEEYNKDHVNEVAKKIEKVYLDEGYEHVKVDARVKKDGDGARVTIIFVIFKGRKERIKKLSIFDSRPDDVPNINQLLDIREGQIYKRKNIQERLKKLEGQLISLGYLKADIRYLKTLDDQGINLEIYVHRGPRLHIYIKGNEFIQKARIMNTLSFFVNRFFDQWEVEESIDNIKRLYLNEGFLDVRINAEIEEDSEIKGDKSVIFNIFEGVRYCLEGVEFENNKYLKDRKLKRQFLSMRSLSLFRPRPFQAITFSEDIKAVEAYYHSEGFPNVKIDVETKETDNKCIKKRLVIDEDKRFYIKTVDFQGNNAFTEKRLKNLIRVYEGEPYFIQEIQRDRKKINIFYGNNGYPYAQVTLNRVIDENEGTVNLHYKIEEGPKTQFGKLFIKRNLTTKDKVIRLATTFKEGELFSYQKILDTQERLSNLGLFKSLSVDPLGLEQREDKVDTSIEVEEMKTGKINLGTGFSSSEGYRGYVEVREENIRGRAITGALRADFSGFGRSYDLIDEIDRSEKYTLSLRDPLFISRHKVEGEGKFYHKTEHKKAYHTRSNGINLSLWRPYKRKNLRVGITYHMDINKLTDITIDPSEISEKEYTVSAIGPTIIYDTRDNFVDPSKGIYTNFNLDWAGDWIGGDHNFYKLQGECRLFIPLSSRLIFALATSGGYIELYRHTEDVPIQERFFAGGGTTVRGFKEESLNPLGPNTRLPIGGNMFWINNIEFRYPLYKNLKGVIFFDAGNVWEKRGNIDLKDLRRSAGIGLRWITPIGPIRFDYGMPIDRKKDEPKSRAYISIGHAF